VSRQINLYDDSFRPKVDLLSARNVLLGCLLSVFLVSMGALVVRWQVANLEQQAKLVNTQLSAQRSAFASVASSLGTRKPDAGLQREVEDTERAVQSAESAIVLLRKLTSAEQQPVVGEMMRAFARAGNDGLWLTGFRVLNDGSSLDIHGRMVDQALLPGYLKRLEGEPVFHGRRFAALDMKGGEWLPVATPGMPVEPNRAQPANGRWYVDFVLQTRREEKSVTGATPEMGAR